MSAADEDAAALYRRAVERHGAGRRAEAAASLREALRLRPDHPHALNLLGDMLSAEGRPAEAEVCFREALRLAPDFADALNGLGAALGVQGRLAEAEVSFCRALALRPAFPHALNNLGNVQRAEGRLAEAERSYREVLRLAPDYVLAHGNLAVTLRVAGRLDEADASYQEALRLAPDNAGFHVNRALGLLLAGRFEEAWPEYEWRWRLGYVSPGARDDLAPRWRGEPLAGRTLLLYAEQGHGDTLQFCRYASLFPPDATVILEVQPGLVRLLAGMSGVSRVVAQGEAAPAADLQCPLISLPAAFGATLATIPADVPYLAADPASASAWRARLAGLPGLKVGLVWAGERRTGQPDIAAADARRSIALKTLAPLAQAAPVSFVSLQKGAPAGEAADPPAGMSLHDFTSELADFADTAALIENLDLVISVDTAVAHLAGAMGKPVWLLNRFDTDWRWLLNRDDSPWYPTLRQFRQPAPGDWASVVAAVRGALVQHAGALNRP